MPYHPTANTAQHALDEVQQLAAQKQYSWDHGTSVSLSSATGTIETAIADGTVIIDGETVIHEASTVTHPDGDPDQPRWDAVCITDRTPTVEVISGVPAEPVTDANGNTIRGEPAFKPAPSDQITDSMVCLALVWIPAGATTNSDLTDTSNGGVAEPIVDRRIKQSGRVGQFTYRSVVQSSGWHRIAAVGALDTSGGGGQERASGLITIRDTQSGQHSTTAVYASINYSQEPTLTLLNTSSFAAERAIAGVRLVYNDVGDGAAVDVNVQLSGQSQIDYAEYTIQNNYQPRGWTPEAWQTASVPSGYTTTRIDLEPEDYILATAGLEGENESFGVTRDGTVRMERIDRQSIGVRGYLSSDQSTSSGSFITVGYDSTTFANTGGFDPSAHEYTVPSQGFYRCHAAMKWRDVPSDTEITTKIQVRGGGTQSNHFNDTGGTNITTSVSDILELSGGDTIFFAAQQFSGGGLDIVGNSTDTYFSITRIG